MNDKIYPLLKNNVFNTSNDLLDKIRKDLTTEGRFTTTEFDNIIYGKTTLETLNVSELCWFILSAENHLKHYSEFKIRALDYFTEIEINESKLYFRENNDKIEFPITFTNVTKMAENQYSFPCTVLEIGKLKRNNILDTMPEFQRETDKKGKIYVNRTRVEEIADKIESGKFKYNTIRFTLINDSSADFCYNEEDDTITIYNGQLIVPDGNHRCIGCELVSNDSPYINDKFNIAFTFSTPREIKDIIEQEWNTQPITRKHREAQKPTNSNKIIDSIKRSYNADGIYVNGIVTTGRQIACNNGFIEYGLLSKAISKYYNTDALKTQDELDEITEWLVKFMNRLTSILVDDFTNFKTVKKTKWSVSPYTWFGYIMISKYLYGNDNWRTELEDIIKSINFDNSVSPLLNKTHKNEDKCIENYFEGVIGDVESK